MAKQTWKPGNMVYPLPAAMVSVGDKDGNTNIITIAWTGTICTNPAMLYISVRPERSTLFTRLDRPFMTEVELLLFTRLFDPLISPFAKSL